MAHIPSHDFCNPHTAILWDIITQFEANARDVARPVRLKKLRHEMDIVLKTKTPFTELLDPPFQTPITPRRLTAMVAALRTYATLLYSHYSGQRRVWQTIEEYWPQVWIWVDFLQRRPSTDSLRLVSLLFEAVRDNTEKNASFTPLLLAQPHAIALLVNVWLHQLRYARANDLAPSFFAKSLAKSLTAVYTDLDNSEIKGIIEREIHRGVAGDAHRLFRHIARVVRLLFTMKDSEEDGALLATLEISSYFIAEERDPLLLPRVMPRAMIYAVVALVQRHAGTVLELMAQSACFFLSQTWTIGTDRRPLIWALHAGLLPALLRMRQDRYRDESASELLMEIHKNLAHRKVLTAFWQAYERDKAAIERAPWQPERLRKIIKRAEKSNKALRVLREVWIPDMGHCHNIECPFPVPSLLQCPCKMAYYCSKECQKVHWNAGHRRNCHMWHWDLIEETKEKLSYPLYDDRDIEFLTQITKEYADHHLDDVFQKAKKIDPDLKRTFMLTVSWAHGEPSHWVTEARSFRMERTVILQVAVFMGRELTLVTLPTATLTLTGPGGLSDSENEAA